MKQFILLLILSVVPCVAAASDLNISKPSENYNMVIATLGNEQITVREFNKELNKTQIDTKKQVSTQDVRRGLLDKLIVKKLLLREAKTDHIEEDKEFREKLVDVTEQLMIETLLRKKTMSASNVSDGDLRKCYDAHKEKFTKEKEIRTRHIVVNTEQEARAMQARITKGEDFEGLAKRYSIDPSASSTGGDVGFHPKGTLIPEYEATAFNLTRIGQVSSPVRTQFGYHLIKLEGVKDSSVLSFNEAKELVRQDIIKKKEKEILQNYIESLKNSTKIIVNESFLNNETIHEGK